jgi:hypothetical protein
MMSGEGVGGAVIVEGNTGKYSEIATANLETF